MERVTGPNQRLPPERQQLIKDLIKALASGTQGQATPSPVPRRAGSRRITKEGGPLIQDQRQRSGKISASGEGAYSHTPNKNSS